MNDTTTPEKAPGSSPPANVKYTGRAVWDKGKRKRLDQNAPIESFSDRGQIVDMPAAAIQEGQRLFYHEQAEQIVRTFPHLYKRVIRKS
jgi:hypothetical protein